MTVSRRTILAGGAALAATPFMPAVVLGQSQTVLHLAHSAVLDSPYGDASERFSKSVMEATEGRVRIEQHANGSLGSIPAQAEGVQQGTIDIALSNNGNLANWAPELDLFDLPFMFESAAPANKAFTGEIEEWRRGLLAERLNVELLQSMSIGLKITLTRNDAPIATADDFKGLRMRAPENPITIQMLSALGASPTPISWTETYTALQTGVVDGVEGTVDSLLSSRFYEVNKSAAKTNHILLDLSIIMNPAKLKSLKPADQDALRAACHESYAVWAGEIFADREANGWAEISKHLTVDDKPDTESMRTKVADLVTNFVKDHKVEKYYEQIKAL